MKVARGTLLGRGNQGDESHGSPSALAIPFFRQEKRNFTENLIY